MSEIGMLESLQINPDQTDLIGVKCAVLLTLECIPKLGQINQIFLCFLVQSEISTLWSSEGEINAGSETFNSTCK